MLIKSAGIKLPCPHPAKINPDTEKQPYDLWNEVKRRIQQDEIRDAQIAFWFQRYCQLDVRLTDFTLPEPPSHITAESLASFLEALEFYTGNY